MPSGLPIWNLKNLIPNPKNDAPKILKNLERKILALEGKRGSLNSKVTSPRFLNILKQFESITEDMTVISAYAFLWYSGNTKDQKARAFDTQIRNQLARLSPRLLFLDLWWQGLPPKTAARISSKATRFRYYLDTLTRLTPHTLSEPEERILTLKNTTGRQALDTLYGVTTNSLSFPLKVKGRKKLLSREELMSYVRHPHTTVRRQAYSSLFTVYETRKDIIGEVYKSLVEDWGNEGMNLRGYASPISVRNMANDVPDAAVTALLNTCRKNAGVFQEYFGLKRRLLKLRTFHRHDLYAPYGKNEGRYSFARAHTLVLEAYRQFSPTLADLANRVLTEQHLDAALRPGKMGGAFCYSVLPTQTPYVLVNYTGEVRDVSTLAHELGHAVHAMMAANHSILAFHSALPLAETASIFGEQLLSDSLLRNIRDPKVKIGFLINQLDAAYATIMRQAYFVQFEVLAHQLVNQGGTIDDLAQIYLDLLKEQFGKIVKVDKAFRWEWLVIPHIFSTPFYCYAYSFGNLLVLALFQRYKQEGPSFVPKYLQLLAGGGSASPQDLLRPLQVDIRARTFWEGGFKRLQHLVGELEGLMP